MAVVPPAAPTSTIAARAATIGAGPTDGRGPASSGRPAVASPMIAPTIATTTPSTPNQNPIPTTPNADTPDPLSWVSR